VRVASLVRIGALALIWGSGFLWIKISLRGFSPVQLTFARLALGAAVLLIAVWWARQKLPTGRSVWLHLFGAALLANGLPYLLFGIAEQHVASNLAGAINATTPLWTVVFVLVTRTAHGVTRIQVAGLLLGFLGAVLILAPWQGTSASVGGALACLAAAASYGAGYVYMSRFLVGRNLAPLVLSAAQLIAATGLLLLAAPLGGLEPVHWRADAVIGLAVLGIVGTGAAYVLNYRIITDDGPVLASTVTYLLPIVAAVLGLTIGEPITVSLVIGIALVLAGVGLTRMRQRPRTPPTPAPQSAKGPRS
jgi:drug/metabolite transporter (DMT)-like permease